MTTDELIDGILEREGGYMDHPSDRGGATNFGITARTLGEYRGLGRTATKAEVKALSVEEARAIYRARYVRPFDTIPFEELRAQLVDIGVTSGPVTAIKYLQRVLGVDVDGVMGERTRHAVAVFPWKMTNNGLVALRVKHMSDDCERNQKQRVFLRGWIQRAVGFVVCLLLIAVSASAQGLPPAPQTCTQAVDQSNLLAYNGHAKNTPDYWCPMYDKDRDYFWKRMLGWQAEGGPDQALSGVYAVPPSNWFALPTHGPIVPDPGTLLPSVDLAPLLNASAAQHAALMVYLADLRADLKADIAATRRDIEEFRAAVRSKWLAIVKNPVFQSTLAAIVSWFTAQAVTGQ